MAPPLAIWIPARRGSTRLPGKLLADVSGKPLITRTVDAARRAAQILDCGVTVVTDCSDIAAASEQAGAAVEFVTEICHCGSDRLSRLWNRLPESQRPDLVINVQGDEPLLPAAAVTALVAAMRREPGYRFGTVMRPGARGGVSVVVNKRGEALYFSRSPLPSRVEAGAQTSVRFGAHVGLYAYRGEFLGRFSGLTQGELERFESLEQLRALEHGVPVLVEPVDAKLYDHGARERSWFAIDTAADLARLAHVFLPSD